MHAAEFAVTVIHGWLECMAVAAAGMVTWKVRFGARQLILVGMAGTVTAQVVRALPLRFGLHTIAMMFVMLALVCYMFKLPFWTASCVTFGGFTLFLFSEEVVCFYILRVLGIHIEDMLANIGLRATFGLVSPAVLTGYCLVVTWMRRLWSRSHEEKANQAS